MAEESLKVWQRVLAHAKRLSDTSLRILFSQDLTRSVKFSRSLWDSKDEIYVDFSKQLIDDQVLDELLALAKDLQITEQFNEMRNGVKINW